MARNLFRNENVPFVVIKTMPFEKSVATCIMFKSRDDMNECNENHVANDVTMGREFSYLF